MFRLAYSFLKQLQSDVDFFGVLWILILTLKTKERVSLHFHFTFSLFCSLTFDKLGDEMLLLVKFLYSQC